MKNFKPRKNLNHNIYKPHGFFLGFLATFICFYVTVVFYRYLYIVVNQIKTFFFLKTFLWPFLFTILATLRFRGRPGRDGCQLHCGTVLGDAFSTWRQICPPNSESHNALWQPSWPSLLLNLKVANMGIVRRKLMSVTVRF